MWSRPTPSSAAAPRERTSPRVLWARSVTVDLASARREHVPLRAELVQALAGVLTGLGVGRVAVERVAVVGDLERPVAALGGPELGRVHAGAGLGLTRGRGGRPQARAGSVAGAHGSLVRLEQVKRASLAVDEGVADVQLAQADRRGGAGGSGGLALLGAAAAAASAACDDKRRHRRRECEEKQSFHVYGPPLSWL